METTRVDGVRRVIEAFTLSQAAPGQRRVARAPPGLVDAVDDARRRGPVHFVVAPEPPPLAPAVLPEVRMHHSLRTMLLSSSARLCDADGLGLRACQQLFPILIQCLREVLESYQLITSK